ncbi:enoyl-ACP reductase FabI [Lactobacillus ultunensis]|uniref:Enoyl-[acyl-carrier-protein] reductase [NADH] n=1 Tax=Lactobacillus ultunensis DSM 16047 TaxID=525365 RepID=C2EKV3_9LACO|nr:enoyl-ACP reductase FabI [Lactobacillus ultunensis]EEJ72810.1 oxidoreductase, short chain dehydrogenase/reductase family protein [Lactobacillus ultunensis DSM 16047]KRL83127.1 enoyl-[acyl-carrier-protein] reductase (NADH) [Lactobacillus ultunensis DSM 16047]QQP29193.1 enoyl-ACP reductase FabI [Lactobacillus ultunensis]
MGFLTGKKILVMGVANNRSIAWGCAQAMAKQGAEIIYTYQNDRLKKFISKLVDDEDHLIECDVSSDQSIDDAFELVEKRFGKIDGIVHAIAFAKKEELGGSILNSTRAGFSQALDVSAYSLLAVAKAGAKILNNPASIVTLTYMGSERALPNYNTMGIAKAALESGMRYLARDLGKGEVRVNAISAGAMRTLAVSGIKGHADLLKESQSETVDGVNVTQTEVGNVCAFLMSDLASGITGDVIYVDKGVHLR